MNHLFGSHSKNNSEYKFFHQEEEITKFARFEEELLKKTEECEALKKVGLH